MGIGLISLCLSKKRELTKVISTISARQGVALAAKMSKGKFNLTAIFKLVLTKVRRYYRLRMAVSNYDRIFPLRLDVIVTMIEEENFDQRHRDHHLNQACPT